MASMGMLGAVGGAAGGFGKAMMLELETARQERLATLKATQDRETNKLNNAERHDYATKDREAAQEFSLDKLKQEDDMARSRMTDQDEMARARQRDQNQFTLDSRQDPEKVRTYQMLLDRGLPDEEAKAAAFGSTASETMAYKPITEEGVDEYGNPTTSTLGYQGLGNRGTVGPYVPNQPQGAQPPPKEPSKIDPAQEEMMIQQIMDANKGKDEAWAKQYLEYLAAEGKL